MSKILLIDDDTDMLLMTSRWLTKAGYEVSKAESGEAALSILSSEKPDLILLDYAMPQMDGPAVLKAIRSDDSLKNIPVLYRTGMDDPNIGEADGQPHPNGVVPKSDGKPGLMNAIKAIL